MSKVIDLVMFPSPQWGNSSKGKQLYRAKKLLGFRPRNGEVILKWWLIGTKIETFQSPQWGVILKEESANMIKKSKSFPSPQWGDCSKTQNKYISYATSDVSVPIMGSNSKDEIHAITDKNLYEFQSPQWGSNSKVNGVSHEHVVDMFQSQ